MAGSLAFPPEFHIGVPRWLNLVALLGSYGFTQMLASERHALVNHKWALWFMNVVPVRILVRGEPATAQGLVVANHTSWLDPIVLAHQEPLRFVTSSDTAEHRFLGWISRLAGCHFVSRKAWTLPEELKALQKGLDNLGRFALFPEATSSNGETILPFRPSLFEIAMRAQVPVQPVHLQWIALDGKPLTHQSADTIHYYGDMFFAPHLKGVMGIRSAEVVAEYLPVLYPQDFSNRKGLCLAAEEAIRACHPKSRS